MAISKPMESVLSLRGGAKSSLYLIFRKVSKSFRAIVLPYLPKSWKKRYSLGGKEASWKEEKAGKKQQSKHKSTKVSSGNVGSAKHNRLQKVRAESV